MNGIFTDDSAQIISNKPRLAWGGIETVECLLHVALFDIRRNDNENPLHGSLSVLTVWRGHISKVESDIRSVYIRVSGSWKQAGWWQFHNLPVSGNGDFSRERMAIPGLLPPSCCKCEPRPITDGNNHIPRNSRNCHFLTSCFHRDHKFCQINLSFNCSLFQGYRQVCNSVMNCPS